MENKERERKKKEQRKKEITKQTHIERKIKRKKERKKQKNCPSLLACVMQIVHCDLALRNIMVSRFPWEVKVAEFGLARDLTRMRSRRSTHKKQRKVSHVNHTHNCLHYMLLKHELLDLGQC